MATLVIMIILLAAVLITVTVMIRRQSIKYEKKGVKDTMSEAMKAAIRHERRENISKKQRFEETLKQAGQTRLEVGEDEKKNKYV